MFSTITSFIPQKWFAAHLIVLFVLLTACNTQPSEPTPQPIATSVPPTSTAIATTPIIEAIPPTATQQQAPATALPVTATALSPTIAPSATVLPTPFPTPLPPIDQQVEISGAAGLNIVGDFRSIGKQPQPTILLLHMLNNRRQSWQPLVPELLANGYTVLAIDMRGHGETGGAMDWSLAEQDLQLVIDWLRERPEVDPAQIITIGGSIGANMALRTAANDAAVSATVLLSAGVNYRGVTTEDALGIYGDRPILIVAAEGDVGAAQSALTLDNLATGKHELIIYAGSGHGTGLFAPHPELIPTIIDWLWEIVG